MDSLEQNHEEWERIRNRADSLANAVFLIAGGALSVSISVMVSAKKSGVVPEAASSIATTGWYCLLAAIILFVTLKIHMIGQAFLLHVKTEVADKHTPLLNGLGWLWGIGGFVTFVWGLVQLVRAASIVISN
ncbi:hypothetical protein [Alcanivorax sp. S71-1-4]|uniref:hypothetical protein n=1 Tax=Alcanivorax sp. S71-1-4 TaxID=1177159 RepID=UPI00135B1354|nr:hypothetical protein [Alcanivorax sp. S71-1-4]